MNVIAHQHVRIDAKTISLPVMFQPFQIALAIGITAKDHLALIAPADHMVKGAGVFDPWFSSHSGSFIPSTGNNAI